MSIVCDSKSKREIRNKIEYVESSEEIYLPRKIDDMTGMIQKFNNKFSCFFIYNQLVNVWTLF